MLRLQPFGYKRISQATSFEASFGGGEANVAVSLAEFGCDSFFVTKLPSNSIADSCVRELKKWDVHTDYIVRGGDRMGLYYCEKGASQRGSSVLYDRAASAVTTIEPAELPLDEIMRGTDWFHFSGITPALSVAARETLIAMLKAAKAAGVTVSCDLNYRKKLWSREQAREVMSSLMQYVDVLFGNEEDAKDVFGLSAEHSDISGGVLDSGAYVALAKKIIGLFPSIKKVAFTLRESYSASRNGWSGLLTDGNEAWLSKKYDIQIVDRVGGGDSFAAGLIYALLSASDGQSAIEFATAASCLKQSVEGDFNAVSVEEIEKLAKGDGSGRIVR